MAYEFSELNKKIQEIGDWVKREMASIRTGQATITLLDSVMVDSYGSKVPINQTASITMEDPKTVRIVPWDKGLIVEIERGITKADLGVSTSVDSEGVRVIFPALTTETRERLAKQARAKIEESKISLRNERNKVAKDIDDNKKNGAMSEDDAKRSREELDKIIKKAQESYEVMGDKKEEEILK